ncbi:hypothetical protein E2C01_024921 [Portunus trituberculatus]|uniref:Uncharacterized protein n=1 Tax=Portunus trituberculatus TaxID=210409 RepID=A0A5B7EEM6_PORTR|nr:hypothetical protein [Portunus trituberculatus]
MLLEKFYGQMPEVSRRVGFRKFSTFSINERVFGKLKNRLDKIPDRNLKDTETVIIPGKISIVPPKVPKIGRGETPEAPPLCEILRENWRNRTRCRYERKQD